MGDEPDLTQVIQQVLARTIPILPPRRRLTFLLDNSSRFKNTELPRVYTFTVNADGPAGAVETLKFSADLDAVAWALLENRPLKGTGGGGGPGQTSRRWGTDGPTQW